MPLLSKFTYRQVALKSYAQQVLENTHGKDIREVVQEAFEKHRGQPRMPMFVGAELGISASTLANWCRDLGIDIDSYRQCEPASSHHNNGEGEGATDA